MSVSERLAALGVDVPAVVPPVASYIPAKRHCDLVYTSAAAHCPCALPATGKVGESDDLIAPR